MKPYQDEEKQRLVELLDKSGWPVKDFPGASLDDFVQKLNDWLADYLLQNGVIVPPCKVGDVVYRISYSPCSKHGETAFSSMCLGCEDPCDSQKTITTFVAPSNTWIVREFIDYAYRCYFVTREEAEQALKERDK